MNGMGNDEKVKRESRALWEAVFKEDTQQFLDYYDAYVADHNKIYVDEDNGKTVAMLHRNPYQICMGDMHANASYIVAVATREECRHQGRMKRLLLEAFADSFREGEPFVYLMPASEKIYLPFGFRTVYYQNILTLGSIFNSVQTAAEMRAAEIAEPGAATYGRTTCGSIRVICRRAMYSRLAELADFSERVLSEKGVVHTKRDAAYYKRIWKEQEAVNGGILLFYAAEGKTETDGVEAGDENAAKKCCRQGSDRKPRLLGWCFTGLEDAAEAWELVLDTEDPSLYAQALRAVTEYFREELPVKVSGLLPGTAIAGISNREYSWRPMTMVRITNLSALAERLCAKAPFACNLHIRDEWIPQNDGWFYLQVAGDGGRLSRLEESPLSAVTVQRHSGACTCVEMTIEELTDVLFGIRCHPAWEAAQIKPLPPLYFNELV